MANDYYRFLDVLAEWFMYLFFDPAYHVTHLEEGQTTETVLEKKVIVSLTKHLTIMHKRLAQPIHFSGIGLVTFFSPIISESCAALIRFARSLPQPLWLMTQRIQQKSHLPGGINGLLAKGKY
ncbi:MULTISPECIES: hypothetical protein [unclassified Carboxylicivirga]|uniref:hypothetical protein n=1 Tax=Carboxylicivirga TaxID=1628153 RepID=UPI003D339651